jgi:hypothetical protein
VSFNGIRMTLRIVKHVFVLFGIRSQFASLLCTPARDQTYNKTEKCEGTVGTGSDHWTIPRSRKQIDVRSINRRSFFQ